MRKILVIIGLVCLQMNSFSLSLLPQLSAVYNSRKNAVVIKWQHTSANIKTYVVQQSSGNKIWTDIALQEVDRPAEPRSFYFEHKKIVVGENHYRLKSIYADGRTEYSLDVLVIIAAAGISAAFVTTSATTTSLIKIAIASLAAVTTLAAIFVSAFISIFTLATAASRLRTTRLWSRRTF